MSYGDPPQLTRKWYLVPPRPPGLLQRGPGAAPPPPHKWYEVGPALPTTFDNPAGLPQAPTEVPAVPPETYPSPPVDWQQFAQQTQMMQGDALGGLAPTVPLLDPNMIQQAQMLQGAVPGLPSPDVPMPQAPIDPLTMGLIQGTTAPPLMDTGPALPPGEMAQGPQAAISSADPMAIQEAELREQALQAIEEKSAVDRFKGSLAARVVDMAPGTLSNAIKKALPGDPEEAEEYARLWLDADRGEAGRYGSIAGVVVPPVLEVLLTKRLAGVMAPKLAGVAPKTAQWLEAAGKDPGELIASGQGVNALKALLVEEIPFVAGDIMGGRSAREILVGAGIGLAAGGVIEIGGAAGKAGQEVANVGETAGQRAVREMPSQVPAKRAAIVDAQGQVKAVGEDESHLALVDQIETGDTHAFVDPEGKLVDEELVTDARIGERRTQDVGVPLGQPDRRSFLRRARDAAARAIETPERRLDVTGVSHKQAWKEAQPKVESDPNLEVTAVDIRNASLANDAFGHEEADNVVWGALGKVLADINGANNAFRVGGDEFVIVHPKGEGPRIQEKIKSSYADREIDGFVLGVDVGTGPNYKAADDAATASKAARTDPDYRPKGGPEPKPEPDPNQADLFGDRQVGRRMAADLGIDGIDDPGSRVNPDASGLSADEYVAELFDKPDILDIPERYTEDVLDIRDAANNRYFRAAQETLKGKLEAAVRDGDTELADILRTEHDVLMRQDPSLKPLDEAVEAPVRAAEPQAAEVPAESPVEPMFNRETPDSGRLDEPVRGELEDPQEGFRDQLENEAMEVDFEERAVRSGEAADDRWDYEGAEADYNDFVGRMRAKAERMNEDSLRRAYDGLDKQANPEAAEVLRAELEHRGLRNAETAAYGEFEPPEDISPHTPARARPTYDPPEAPPRYEPRPIPADPEQLIEEGKRTSQAVGALAKYEVDLKASQPMVGGNRVADLEEGIEEIKRILEQNPDEFQAVRASMEGDLKVYEEQLRQLRPLYDQWRATVDAAGKELDRVRAARNRMREVHKGAKKIKVEEGRIPTPEDMDRLIQEHGPELSKKQKFLQSIGWHSVKGTLDELSQTKVGRALRRGLTVAADTPQLVFDSFLKSSARHRRQLAELQDSVARIGRMIQKDHGIDIRDDMPEDFLQSLNAVLQHGSASERFSPALSGELRQLRQQVDALSNALIAEGHVDGKLALTIDSQLGSWLTKTYRAFEKAGSTKWQPTEEVVTKAHDLFVSWGLESDEAMDIVKGMLVSDDFKSAWRQVAQIRYGAAESGRVLKARAGFVPPSLRDGLKNLLGEKRYLTAEVDEMIDSYIGREPFDERILEAIEERLNSLRKHGRTGGDIRQVEINERKIRALSDYQRQLIDRREIPEELRTLLGEENNPIIRALHSVDRVSKQLEGARLARTIQEVGLLEGWVRRMGDTPLGEDWVPLSQLDNKYARELDIPDTVKRIGGDKIQTIKGKRTPNQKYAIEKDVLDSMNQRFAPENHISGIRKYLGMASFIVKGNLTYRNPPTHVRNLLGTSYFHALNGHLGLHNIPAVLKGDKKNKLIHAYKVARESMAQRIGGGDPAMKKYLMELTELDVVDSSVMNKEFVENVKDFYDSGLDFNAWVRGKQSGLKGKVKDLDRFMQDLYRVEDDMAKILVYENSLADLRAAWEGKPGAPRLNELKEEAARLSRDLYPNYNLLPPWVQELRRVPILSSFPSFAWEVMRTSANTVKQAMKELQDPVLRPIGIRRAMGIAQTISAPIAAKAFMGTMLGMSREEVQGLARNRGEFQEYNTIVPLWKRDDGVVYYADLGYVDPANSMRAAVIAMFDRMNRGVATDEQPGRTLVGGLQAGAWEAAEPFLQEDILFKAFMDVGRNVNQFGYKIYEDEDEQSRVKDIAMHMGRSLMPGVMKTGFRIGRSMGSRLSPNLTDQPLWAELAEFAGARVQMSNAVPEMGWRLGEVKERLFDAESSVHAVMGDVNENGPQDVDKALEEMERKRTVAFYEGGQAVQDARNAGASEKRIRTIVEGLGLDNFEEKALLGNYYVPNQFGPTFKKRLEEKLLAKATTPEQGAQLVLQLRRRLAYLRSRTEGGR